MDTAALVIAILGLVLAVLSLAWQAVTFVLTGPRVKVHLKEGLPQRWRRADRLTLDLYS
jgi:hypothetical protein